MNNLEPRLSRVFIWRGQYNEYLRLLGAQAFHISFFECVETRKWDPVEYLNTK